MFDGPMRQGQQRSRRVCGADLDQIAEGVDVTVELAGNTLIMVASVTRNVIVERAVISRARSPDVPSRDERPVGHHQHAISEMFGLIHVVRRQQDGGPRAREGRDETPRIATCCRVEASRWFVEEQHVGMPDEPECQVESAALPTRQVPHSRRHMCVEADHAQKFGRIPGVRVERGAHVQRFYDGDRIPRSRSLAARRQPCPEGSNRRSADRLRGPGPCRSCGDGVLRSSRLLWSYRHHCGRATPPFRRVRSRT